MTETLHLIARIAGRAVAIPADQVDSVVDLSVITPVPMAALGVAGLAALRSRVVTVIDPCVEFGAAPDERELRRAIVTRVDGHAYAILVQTLEDVASYRVDALPAGLALGSWAGPGHALIERDGEPVLVIDLGRLIPHQPALAA